MSKAKVGKNTYLDKTSSELLNGLLDRRVYKTGFRKELAKLMATHSFQMSQL